MTIELLLLFAAQFIFIFLKAFQQRNVAHLHYWPVMPVSLLMALTEVYVISIIAISVTLGVLSWQQIVALAIGSGTGCLVSMYLHSKAFK